MFMRKTGYGGRVVKEGKAQGSGRMEEITDGAESLKKQKDSFG